MVNIMKKRTSIPNNNKYYIRQVNGGLNGAVQGYPTIAGANVLSNCVGMANGRFNEIINDPNLKGIELPFRYQLVCNAENFIESAKKQGLKISRNPTLGGIMVWQKGATLGGGDGAGHVAVVEDIYADGSILTSESGWGSRDWAFKNIHRNNSNGRWGQAAAYKFRGCIINPSIKSEVKGTYKLTVDGIGGTDTVMRMQEFFSMAVMDGVITGQNLALQKKYYPSLVAVKGGTGGSVTVKALQKWVGVTQDGILGQATVKALQKKIGLTADGIFGTGSMKTWQTYLNTHDKPDNPKPTPERKKYKVIDVSEWQGTIDWKKVKADGVVGAIIRYADGDHLDPNFKSNMMNAKAHGLHIGAYIFSRAKTAQEAQSEARLLFNSCKQYAPDMPLYIDLEAKGLEKVADTVAQAFLDEIKKMGGTGGVYANLNWWNNYLKKTREGSFALWVAQYNDTLDYKPTSDVGMWQYSSKGKVNGIKGNVDMDECYVEYWKDVKPTPTPTPTPTPSKHYTGKYPTLTLKKTYAQAMADTVEWAKWISNGNDFHYGYGAHAHHNGCYFCGTQPASKKNAGIKMWETTYCCNPFVTAALGHGGCIPTMLKLCSNGKSWVEKNFKNSTIFDNLGKPNKSSLKAGDVLCCLNGHVMLYIGDGKLAEAANGDDNVPYSKSWNDSISVSALNNTRWNNKSYGVKSVFRYNGSVDTVAPLKCGEISDRVKDLNDFLKWCGYKVEQGRIFKALTRNAVKEFQKLNGLEADGIVGKATIDAMQKYVKK